MSWLDSFEYLCYESTTIINIFTLTVRVLTLDVRIWRLQTPDSKVDPRAVRVNSLYPIKYPWFSKFSKYLWTLRAPIMTTIITNLFV